MKTRIRKAVFKMSGYTPGEQPSDSAVIKLNTNENPYPPSSRVAATLAKMNAEALRLYPDPVCRRLREILADLHNCLPEQVFCANGSDEILALATRAFVEDRGKIGCFEPSYSLYPVLAKIRGVACELLELGSDFAWRMPREFSCSLFFLTNPNAPTGLLFDKKRIRAFCRRFKGVVALDEAYVDFASADCMDIALEMPNVLALRTLSKSYSLAGLRFGYAVGAAPLIEALYKIKDSYNVNRLTQELAVAALLDQAHMRRNVRRILSTRRRLAVALGRLGFFVHPSEANFLWVRPPAGIDAAALYQDLRSHKIFVRHFPGPRTGGYLRITIGDDRQTDSLLRIFSIIFKEKNNEN